MTDLSKLSDNTFDYIINPISKFRVDKNKTLTIKRTKNVRLDPF